MEVRNSTRDIGSNTDGKSKGMYAKKMEVRSNTDVSTPKMEARSNTSLVQQWERSNTDVGTL